MIHASGFSPPGAPATGSLPPLLPPNSLLFRRSFLGATSGDASRFGVPDRLVGRLLLGDEPREDGSRPSNGGGSRGSKAADGSTGWMVGCKDEALRGEVGGGYSGARYVADEMRFRTLVRRLPDSEAAEVLFTEPFSAVSGGGLEKRLDRRFMDLFFSPMVSMCRLQWLYEADGAGEQ